MKLIPEWRRAWRMLSMQFAAIAVAWVALPADAQATVLKLIPGLTEDRMTGALILLAMVGRIVAQRKVRE